MKLNDLIKRLEEIRVEHGGDVPVLVLSGELDRVAGVDVSRWTEDGTEPVAAVIEVEAA